MSVSSVPIVNFIESSYIPKPQLTLYVAIFRSIFHSIEMLAIVGDTEHMFFLEVAIVGDTEPMFFLEEAIVKTAFQ